MIISQSCILYNSFIKKSACVVTIHRAPLQPIFLFFSISLNISNCLGDSSSICSFLYSSMVFFPLLVNPLEKSLLSFSSKSGRPNCAILVYILSVISHSTPLASILSATSRCSLIVGTAMINFLPIQFFTISAYCSVFPKAVCAFIMWISAFLAATASSSIFLSTDTHLSIL